MKTKLETNLERDLKKFYKRIQGESKFYPLTMFGERKLHTKIISGYDYQVRRDTERYLRSGCELIQAPHCADPNAERGWQAIVRG